MVRGMKQTSVRSFLAVALGLGFAACSASADGGAIGAYALDVDALIKGIPAMAAMPAEQMADMKSKMSGTIELKADHTMQVKFDMGMGGMGNIDASGTWKLEGDKLSMTGEDADGNEETTTGTLKDGVLAMSKEEGGQAMTMTFHKK